MGDAKNLRDISGKISVWEILFVDTKIHSTEIKFKKKNRIHSVQACVKKRKGNILDEKNIRHFQVHIFILIFKKKDNFYPV